MRFSVVIFSFSVHCRFVQQNIIQTLLLNQFFVLDYKHFPKILKVVPYFFLEEGNLFDFSQVFFFLYVFCFRRARLNKLFFKNGRVFVRRFSIYLTLCNFLIFDFLYFFFSLIINKVDVYTLIKLKTFKLGKFFISGGPYIKRLFMSSFRFNVNDLRGVSFFDRSVVFLQWQNRFSVFCFFVTPFGKRQECLVLLRNWKFAV